MRGSGWFAVVAALGTTLGGCYESHGLHAGTDAGASRRDAGVARVDAGAPGVDASTPDPDAVLVWVLVHPSDAPTGAGIYLFDETHQEVIRRLPLPDEAARSPHALAWDGRSLWIGGAAFGESVAELDPETGAVRSAWSRIVQTEGIAIEDGRYWYFEGALHEVTPEGAIIAFHPLPEVVVQDLVAADGVLYYLVNDDLDRIMRFDPDTEALREIARGVDVAPYALGFDGTNLVVAVHGRMRRYDPSSGAFVRESPLGVPGWITAIAYVR